MKFKTLSMASMIANNDIKTLKVYFGSFNECNLILNIKDIENATKKEGNLVVHIEENEEVKSFLVYNHILSVLLK